MTLRLPRRELLDHGFSVKIDPPKGDWSIPIIFVVFFLGVLFIAAAIFGG